MQLCLLSLTLIFGQLKEDGKFYHSTFLSFERPKNTCIVFSICCLFLSLGSFSPSIYGSTLINFSLTWWDHSNDLCSLIITWAEQKFYTRKTFSSLSPFWTSMPNVCPSSEPKNWFLAQSHLLYLYSPTTHIPFSLSLSLSLSLSTFSLHFSCHFSPYSE